jgi:hypothetical protein
LISSLYGINLRYLYSYSINGKSKLRVQLNLQKGKRFVFLTIPIDAYVYSNFSRCLYFSTIDAASYLDLHLEIDKGGRLKSKLYDKCTDFIFPIVNFPFIKSNIPAPTAY